jgi:hypothetical protein
MGLGALPEGGTIFGALLRWIIWQRHDAASDGTVEQQGLIYYSCVRRHAYEPGLHVPKRFCQKILGSPRLQQNNFGAAPRTYFA